MWWWFPAVAFGSFLTVVALTAPPDRRLTDLSVYLGAVEGMRHGDSLYDFIRADAPFTYPPFAGLLFQPLTALPVLAVQISWSVATVLLVLGLAVLFSRQRGIAAGPGPWFMRRRGIAAATRVGGRHAAPLLGLLLMLSLAVSSNMRFGQVSLFLAALVAVDVLALGRTRGHGALIGLCAAIKLTPLIFIPLLWFSGRRRAATIATAAFVACGAVTAIVLPGDSWRFWTTEVRRIERIGYLSDLGNQSLNGALMRFAVPDQVRLPIVLLVGGSVVAAALWCAVRLDRDGDRRSALILVGVAGLVLSPVSWTHHQIWLALAVLLPMTVPARVVVLGLAILPATALGGPVWSNVRLLLAVAIVAGQVAASGRSGPAAPRLEASPGLDAPLKRSPERIR